MLNLRLTGKVNDSPENSAQRTQNSLTPDSGGSLKFIQSFGHSKFIHSFTHSTLNP
jgi:hypothetical protein